MTAQNTTPMNDARLVQVNVNGKMKTYNVVKLLASSLLGRDVTGDEWGAFIAKDGIWVENHADRKQLNEKLKIQCENFQPVGLAKIIRPGSETIYVTGKGYYTKGGKVYGKNGNVIAVDKSGHLLLTSDEGQIKVHLAWILFNAYPDFYGFSVVPYDQVNHIDGDRKNNEPWNFRPVTADQNTLMYYKPE